MTDLNDQEQWEAIKAWWKENGRTVITTVVIVVVATLGFRYWQNVQNANDQQASILYDQLLNKAFSSTTPSDQEFTRIANQLQESYSKTPYAANAALFEAKAAIEKNDLKKAKEKLTWVMEYAKDNNVQQIARLRLARVLLIENQADQAMKTVSEVDSESYLPAINLVKGDIYLAKGNSVEARKFYQEALKALPANQSIRQYLQMQIDQL